MNAFRQKLSKQLVFNRSGILRSMALSTTLISVNTAVSSNVSFCAGKNEDEDMLAKIKATLSSSLDVDAIGQSIGNKVQDAISTGVPTQISYGFVCGFSSGYALRKVGKVASVVFGLGFATLQTLAYAGYIEVNHTKLKNDVEKVLDANRDGKLDGKDAEYALDNVLEILQYNMVGGSGFVAGFLGGFRSG